MKPPVETEAKADAPPGFYELTVAGLTGEPEITYLVQLPPEYDPYRRYPCVVTLNGAGTTPQQQVDWWAGTYNEQAQMRLGQAARYGCIVVAPHWSRPHQVRVRILGSRACRRAAPAAGRLPPILDRHGSRVPERPFDGRRRDLGHRLGSSGSLGGRHPDRRDGGQVRAALLGERPLRPHAISCAARWTATR